MKTTEIQKKDDIEENSKNDETDCIVAQVTSQPKDLDESEYPQLAYKMSESDQKDLFSISSSNKKEEDHFIPEDAVLVEGIMPVLDEYVFNVIDRMIKSDFTLCVPNQHIVLLIDISELSGSGYKNEYLVNIMVTMELLSAFEIRFSVWIFSSSNVCFCVKRPDEEFDNKRKCLIRDAYFLKRKNQYSYKKETLKR